MALKVLELFGGIGACTCALKRLGIPIEIVDYVEIDKYAVNSYNAINGTNFTPQDVKKWDKDVQVDFLLHGSPCQDFSLAGLQRGGDKGSGTRSSLMYETLRIVKKLKPKYVVWENVANLLSEKHFHNFANYLNAMASFGYASAYKLLNSKDYGIPQNRERVFTVSVFGGTSCDLLGEELLFDFPKPIPLKLRLKDLLQDNPDSKYFLSQRIIDFFKRNEEEQAKKGNGFRFGVSDGNVIAHAVTTRAGSRMDDNFIEVPEKYYLSDKGVEYVKSQIGKPYHVTDINPEIAIPHTTQGQMNWSGSHIAVMALDEQNGYVHQDGVVGTITTDGSSPKHNNRVVIGEGEITSGSVNSNAPAIPIKNATKQGYLLAEEGDGVDIGSRMEHHRGTVQKGMSQTITTAGGGRKRCCGGC